MVSKAKYPMFEMQDNVVVVYGAFRSDGTPTGLTPPGTGFNFVRNSAGDYTIFFDKYGSSTDPTNMKILYVSAYCISNPLVPLYTNAYIQDNEINISTTTLAIVPTDPIGTISVRAAILYSNSQV